MKINILISTLLMTMLVSGCSTPRSSGNNFTSNYFYSRCVQNETKKGDENASEYCQCVVRENPTLVTSKIIDTNYACDELSTIRKTKVEPFKQVCEEFDDTREAKVGDIVQVYKSYVSGKWVIGANPSYNGIVWKIVKIDNSVYFDLVEGTYAYMREGEPKRMGGVAYQYYNPEADRSVGVIKSLRVCKNYQPKS